MTTQAERDELRRLIAQNPGVMFVPVPGGLVKELLDEVDQVVADERAACADVADTWVNTAFCINRRIAEAIRARGDE